MNIMLEIVGVHESRSIREERNLDGSIRELIPVCGSETATLSLKLPDGKVIKVGMDHRDFVGHVLPLYKGDAPDILKTWTRKAE